MKVLITGAKGTLGTELRRQLKKLKIPYVGADRDVDVCNHFHVLKAIADSECDIVIHCAAITDTVLCETEKELAYNVNVKGTRTVAQLCRSQDVFMVHISTDYVFSGDKIYVGNGREGNYDIHDAPDPVNYYSFTKAVAEEVVRSVCDEHLIVRTSFCPEGLWPYNKAFVDQHTSRDTVDVIAEQIIQAVLQKRHGTVHLGTERKTVYDLAKRSKPNVMQWSRLNIEGIVIPEDTSLKLTE